MRTWPAFGWLAPSCRAGLGAVTAAAWLVAADGGPLSAQAPNTERKQASATRVNAGTLRLDGRLDEAAWATAPVLTGFTQKDPSEGAAATEPTSVRFLYDNTGLYVGARMQSGAAVIQAPMTRRDDGEQAEYILIDLDTYLDRRTSYGFGVTASGVRLDRYHSSDDEDYDSNFDPVWQARTQIESGGWTAELWIPFSQLRFNNRDDMVWGLNVTRSIPAKNERDYWMLVPKNESGWASRFGDLRGFLEVQPPRRLEWLPYASSTTRLTGTGDSGNPFDDGTKISGRGGVDVRVGIGSSLTLDATVNPDFGQIDADPAEVNLSAFETFFNERRPFFLEGLGLISRQSNFFYTRRVGARPSGPIAGDFVDYPETSTILGAAKLTGRIGSRTSLGILGAVTDQEFAQTAVGDLRTHTRVAPRTEYGAGRFQQEFGTQGSYVGVEMTALHRNIPDGDPLAAVFVRSAFSGITDALLRFGGGTYEARGALGTSFIDGSPAAIERRQRSSVRYFQRPDGPPGRLDPTRTSLGGGRFQASLNKIAGRHWLWGGDIGGDSPELDTNDAGRLGDASDIGMGAYLTYRETEPGRLFHSYSYEANVNRAGNFDGALGGRLFFGSSVNVTWTNFWYTFLRVGTDLPGKDPSLTRGGPSMTSPGRWNANVGLGNSEARQFRWSGNVFYSGSEIDGDTFQEYNLSLSARPTPPLQLSFGPGFTREVQSRQYVETLDGDRPDTYDQRYVFGVIDRTTLSAQIRASMTFKPDLNLDLYAEPFAASGRYNGFGELAAAGGKDLRIYGTNGITLERQPDGTYLVTDGAAQFPLENGDFNIRSFRSNIVLRWEWRPGSTFFVIWQQNRFDNRPSGEHVGAGDLFGGLSAPGGNIFGVKMTVWLSK